MNVKKRTKSGFTILELVVVVIIVGILSTIGFVSFAQMIEKSRTAEAKMILGQIRQSERGYFMSSGAYTTAMDIVGMGAPESCASTYYFSYTISSASGVDFTGQATRCTSGGKFPDNSADYTITVDGDGNWGGSAGYY